jgi:hypothetical protein
MPDLLVGGLLAPLQRRLRERSDWERHAQRREERRSEPVESHGVSVSDLSR